VVSTRRSDVDVFKSLGALRLCLPGIGFAGAEWWARVPVATNSEVSRHAADRGSADS